ARGSIAGSYRSHRRGQSDRWRSLVSILLATGLGHLWKAARAAQTAQLSARNTAQQRRIDMMSQHDMKVRFGRLLLSPLALLAAACVAETGDATSDTGSETVGEAQEEQIKRTPETGESCHVVGFGITNGTMTKDGECCGVRTCSDRLSCGKDYGHYVPACAAC